MPPLPPGGQRFKKGAMMRRAGLGLLCLAAVLAGPARADDLADALATPIASGLTGARDIPRFAWVENAAGVRNIWVADPGKPALQLTAFADDDGQQLYDVSLTRDGARLAFVRGGDDEFADGKVPNPASATVWPSQQVFLLATAGGAPQLIGDGHAPVFDPAGDRLAYTRRGEIWLWDAAGGAKKIAQVAGEVTRLQWSPDGKRLLFVDNRDDHAFVALLDLGAAQVRYLDPGLDYSVEPCFSPDGSQVAFIRYMDPPTGAQPLGGPYWSIRVADAATGAARTLWTPPAGFGGSYAGTRSRNLFWSADGKLIFPWEHTGWLHPYAIDAARGGTPRELTPGYFEVETFLPGADGRSLIFAGNAGDVDRRHVWRMALDGKPKRIGGGDGIESFPTLAGDTLAVIATDATHIAHPALADGLKPLGKAPTVAGVTPEQVIFKAEDGVEVHAQLFRARGPGKHPALIYVHGGPHRQMLLGFNTMGYYSNAYILNQHLAAEGYDVLSVNYRSGTGYGLTFREAPGIAREGATEYRDVLAGGRWLAAQDFVDPARIGIWGGSWGGYLTALALARNSDLFAAGVDFHGVHAMVRPVDNNLSPDQQAAARQLQWTSSPMGSIEHWRSPVLLIHGDDDKSVDFGQSLLLARELAARHVPFEELVFPNERHEFLRYADWLAAYRATDAFLAKTLLHRP